MNLLPFPTHIAVIRRSAYVALTLLGQSDTGRNVVLAVHSTRVAGNPKDMLPMIRKFSTDYGVTYAVVEAGSPLIKLVAAIGLQVETTTLAEAKQALTGTKATTHPALFQMLITREPQLRRLVTVLTSTEHIKLSERWNTVQLLSVALGLAAVNSSPPHHSINS